MLLNFSELIAKYSMKIRGVVQCGAHFGEEIPEYVQANIKEVVLIEPCEAAFEILKKRFEDIPWITLIRCACGDNTGLGVMTTESTNQGMSNSLLNPKVHLEQHREVVFDNAEIVKVDLLDNLEFDRSKYNLLNMDCQGYEAHVLRGATETIKHIDYIITEVNRLEMYEQNAMVEDLDSMLSEFKRVETGWASDYHGWGDALYLRKTLL